MDSGLASTPDDQRPGTGPDSAAARGEARFRELAESAYDIIYGIDRTGHVAFHNSAAVRLLEHVGSELIGRHYLDLVAESDRARVHRFYLRQMARKIPNTYFEFLASTVDGSRLWLGQNVQLIVEDHEVVGFNAVARDVTEQREIERQLRESEELFRRSFDDAPIGMALVGVDGRFLRVNRRLVEIVGYDESELLDRSVQSITHPGDLEEGIEQTLRALAGEIGSDQRELRYVRRDGDVVWMLLSVSLVRDDGGRPLYYVAQIQDVSERRRMLDEIARSRDAAVEIARVKSAFLATMSHEVRTPLNGILGIAGLMLAGDLTREQREYLTSLNASAQTLLGILNDVLDVSELDGGDVPIATADVDVRAIVADVVRSADAAAAEKRLQLSSIVYRGVPERISADPERLSQVLAHLVGNAVKFTDVGDILVRVKPSVDAAGRGVLRFEVADTGIGISEIDIPRLFDRFTQADQSSSRRHGGTGLGLAISQRLVSLMGGSIGVIPDQQRGTTFWFEIPLADVGREAPAAAPEVEPARTLRVLVVEDNAINRMVTLGQLRQQGIDADIAVDGWRAVEAVARRRYDLIFMDCDMPELDGYDATELIRRYEAPDERAVIIALTAHAVSGARERCIASGMDDYLSKPVSARGLVESVQRYPELLVEGSTRRAAIADEPILDVRALAELDARNDTCDGVDDVLGSFVRGATHRLALLEAAIEEGRLPEAQQIAHQLAASARSLGARRLARLLAELERKPAGRVECARYIMRAVRTAFVATMQELGAA